MKKQFSKLFCLAFAMCFAFGVAAPAFAAGDRTRDMASNVVANGRYVAAQDGWIYYRHGEGNNTKLYKSKTNGSSKTLVYEPNAMITNINPYGDDVYFYDYMDKSICKVGIDGTGFEKIADITTNAFFVTDGWIYYSDLPLGGPSYCICRIKTDGTSRQVLSGQNVAEWQIYGKKIYYCDRRQSKDSNGNLRTTSYLCSMNLDGSGKKDITSPFGWAPEFVVNDGWVYFTSNDEGGNYFYKIRTDGTSRQLLIEEEPQGFSVVNGYVYYYRGGAAKDWQLVKLKTDGTGRKVLHKGVAHDLVVIDGWIYFTSLLDGYRLEKITTSGKSKQRIK